MPDPTRLGAAGNHTGGMCIVSCGVLRLVSTIQASGNAATTAMAGTSSASREAPMTPAPEHPMRVAFG